MIHKWNREVSLQDQVEVLNQLSHHLAVACMRIDGDQIGFVTTLMTREDMDLEKALRVLCLAEFAFGSEREE